MTRIGSEFGFTPASRGRIIRADRDKAFTCEPGYITGDRSGALGLSQTGDRRPVGIALADIPAVRWFDPDKLKREDTVIVSRRPVPADSVAAYLPGAQVGAEKSLTLPFLHSQSGGGTLTYYYALVPPQGCVPE